MGNISTHEAVGVHVIASLRAQGVAGRFAHLLLGNFLTDLSQFRDPYAYVLAKRRLGTLGLTGLAQKWRDEMLGTPTRRHGALAGFLQHFSECLTHIYFSSSSGYAASLISDTPLDPADVTLAFKQRFTQYYPHEHMDLPPYKEGQDQKTDPLKRYQPASSRRYGYLDEQIRWLAQDLGTLERRWREARLSGTEMTTPDLFWELGHLLHAVEDFYFHSNVTEVWRWQQVERMSGKTVPAPASGVTVVRGSLRALLLGAPLAAQLLLPGEGERSVRQRRRFARRLRYPLFSEGVTLDDEDSEDATEFIYTGSFGDNDVFHTISDALVDLEASLDRQEPSQLLKNSPIAFMRTMLNRNVRVAAAKDPAAEKALVTKHREQLQRPKERAAVMATLGEKIGAEAAAALEAAFALDEEFDRRYRRNLFGALPSPGMFLIRTLVEMERKVGESDEAAAALDRSEASVTDLASANGASAEDVGSHSLLSKDSEAKYPMRAEALRGAKAASQAVASLMIGKERSPARGIDWQAVLDHLLRFPSSAEPSWESSTFDLEQPLVPHLKGPNRPPLRPAGAVVTKPLRPILEKLYTDLEVRAQRASRPTMSVP